MPKSKANPKLDKSLILELTQVAAPQNPQIDITTGRRYYHMRDNSWLECDPIVNQVGMLCHEVSAEQVPKEIKQRFGILV